MVALRSTVFHHCLHCLLVLGPSWIPLSQWRLGGQSGSYDDETEGSGGAEGELFCEAAAGEGVLAHVVSVVLTT